MKEEVFSLEDDYGDIFITQSDKIVNSNGAESCSNGGILPDPMDFSSPNVSLISRPSQNVQYSDISDDETFDIPSLQKHQESSKDYER